MKRKFYLLLLVVLSVLSSKQVFADAILTTQAVPAANIMQGSNNNIVYIVKVDATVATVTMSAIQFTLGGTYDNNDLGTLSVYYNTSAASLTGASIATNTSAAFAAPHPYNLPLSFVGTVSIPAGSSVYFLITVTTNATATDGNTIKVNGAVNPVTFTYTTAPTVVNNQTDAAGTQTIEASDVTISNVAVPAADILQGTNNNIIYIAKMDVATLPVAVNRIQFTFSGTHGNNDLVTVSIYHNPTAPSMTGASLVTNSSAAFAAPHAYDLFFSFVGSINIAAGNSGYFLVTVNTAATATDGNTIKVNGAANPVTFSYTTAPNVSSTQPDIAGVQTIQASDVTVTNVAVPATDILQGTNNNIIYIAKMDAATLPVAVNRIQFTFSGTHDNNDLVTVSIYHNPTAPSMTGASLVTNSSAAFAAPHAYDLFFSFVGSINITTGSSGYFLITVNTAATATDGNTIKVNGAANPVTFSYTTAPNVSSTQPDIAGAQTIQASDVTATNVAVPAADILQGTNNNIIYIAKMDVATLPVAVNRIQFTFSGTHDNNDLVTVSIYHNPTAPSMTGASLVTNSSATFAAPHAYDLFFSFVGSINITAGSSGYFLITVNTAATATDGNTIKVNGAANPVTFSYTTAPNVTSTQPDLAGVQTIQSSDVTVSSVAVPAGTVLQATNNNIVYIAKMDAATLPIAVNRIQFTLNGTHDNNDLTTVSIYHNATAPSLTGASLVTNASAAFAGPHAYDLFFSFVGSVNIASGSSGYFIITVNVAAGATDGNTIKVNGAAEPVTFSYTTTPNVVNNQTDIAGVQAIGVASVTVSNQAVAASNIAQGSNNNIVYIAKMDVAGLSVQVSNIQFVLGGTHDDNDLTTVAVYHNATAPTLTGATLLTNSGAAFAAPHTYNLFFSFTGSINIAAGGSGYFIITANTSTTATDNNTVKINGAANPVTFSYTTAPGVTNNQPDAAGTQTIQASDLVLSSSAVAASTILQNSNNNVVYIARMDAAVFPISVSAIQYTLSGTHDNNDLVTTGVYYNATSPVVAGATFLGNTGAGFAAPHTYNVPFSFSGNINIAAGSSGYFIVTVNTSAGSTLGNTIKLNGATDPVTFSYTTGPNVTNSQTDAAGAKTIGTALPLTLQNFTGRLSAGTVSLQWITIQEINTKDFDIEWRDERGQFTHIATVAAAGNSSASLQYNYTHTSPSAGNNFYRLKMNDLDGKFSYSPVVRISSKQQGPSIQVFPNPVVNVISMQVESEKNETVVFNLVDVNGKMISSRSFILNRGSNRLSWDVKEISAGIYYVVSADGQLKTSVMKQ